MTQTYNTDLEESLQEKAWKMAGKLEERWNAYKLEVMVPERKTVTDVEVKDMNGDPLKQVDNLNYLGSEFMTQEEE